MSKIIKTLLYRTFLVWFGLLQPVAIRKIRAMSDVYFYEVAMSCDMEFYSRATWGSIVVRHGIL